ncbi:simple sugar transport system permease protein [Alkalithermobacter thermoalcaliphilus JW-YL-7 = DSM 7308]|uniref:ABC-type transporter, integral membrane subunit n=1 Tax=Alkalithermobacter thermoalcaliphilus JW-YL-7 = DSM 7308 TaxID=1121328 RepID=A0A150FQ32_CLOPD|nr:ABC-type transporter, integral membrane subunit [[Clostridium] paradoxum JW-YL-7 = DSM 7308]SHK83593.1 simple sugar transport system permease protein [[Clostridium] paradoxum JW-YL-7 = DSM 7308]
MLKNIALIISTTLMYSTPLIFASLGGIFSESAGVVNIGLEGMMTIGAFAGAATAVITGDPWIAFLVAGIAGGLFGLIHAIATVTFNADHVVSGIAINFLAPGLALFICRELFDGSTMTPAISLNNKMPRPLNGIFDQGSFLDITLNTYATVYIAFLLVALTWFILYKTKLGIRIRAVGEHPRAADTLGINVYKIKYLCVILSGVLAGLGGASISIAIVSTFRPTLISGQGFIALAAVIFGKWKPQGAMLASLLFGASTGLVVFLGGPDIGLEISENILSMVPYIITLIVLIAFVGNSNGPAANGLPYEKGER